MKSVLSAVVFILALSLGLSLAVAEGITVDLKNANAGTLYDFNEQEFLAIAFISPIKYDNFSLDVGAFKDLDNCEESNISGILIGLGYTLKEQAIPKLNNPTIHIGLGGGVEPNSSIGKDELHYGVYTTLAWDF